MIKRIAALIVGLGVIGQLLSLAALAAWITHVVWWIRLAMNEQLDTAGEFALAIIGTLFAPIGVIHGIILWF